MSSNQAESDAIHRLLGYTQEYLDNVRKGAEKYRAGLGSQLPAECEDLESDSDFDSHDESHLAPLSPPPTPKAEGLNQPLSEHAQRALPNSAPPPKSSVRRRNPRPAVTASKR